MRTIRELLFPNKEPTFRGDPDGLSPEQRAELGLARIAALNGRAAELRWTGYMQQMPSASSERSTGSRAPTLQERIAHSVSPGSNSGPDVADEVDAIYVDVSGQEPEKSRFDLIDLGSLDKQDE